MTPELLENRRNVGKTLTLRHRPSGFIPMKSSGRLMPEGGSRADESEMKQLDYFPIGTAKNQSRGLRVNSPPGILSRNCLGGGTKPHTRCMNCTGFTLASGILAS